MKRETVAMSGRCVIPAIRTTASADEILRVHNIKLISALPVERLALANGVAQASALLGGRVGFASNVEFSFSARTGYSRYDGVRRGMHIISMNRCLSTGKNCAPNNIAHLMHELGHRVGHAVYPGTREEFYAAYSRLVGSCKPTAYSRKNLYEEFAEVFAAFITHPEILSTGDSSCKRAFAFFSRDVFRANGTYASCQPAARQILMARLPSLEGVQVPSVDPPAPVAPPTARPTIVAQAPPAARHAVVAKAKPAPRPNMVAQAKPAARPVVPLHAQPPRRPPIQVAQLPPQRLDGWSPPVTRPRPGDRRRPANEWYFSTSEEEEEFQQEAQVETASLHGWLW